MYARTHTITLQTPNYVYYYIALLLLLQRVVVASRSKLYNAMSEPRVLRNVRAGGGSSVYNFLVYLSDAVHKPTCKTHIVTITFDILKPFKIVFTLISLSYNRNIKLRYYNVHYNNS